jgi:hypothetical protein
MSGLLVWSAHAGGKGRGRSIEFSVPKSDEVSTNLHQMTTKKDGLKQLEEDLYQPLQSLGPRSSLEGVAAPLPRVPAGPMIQSKRVKELLERKKNWVFMSPEDMLSTPTIESILKAPKIGPDGQEKRELPALERYYQRLSIKRGGMTDPMQSRSGDAFGTPGRSKPGKERTPSEDWDLPTGVRENAQQLGKLFEPGGSDSPFAENPAHGSLSDTFGLANNTPSKLQVQEHRRSMDEYRTVVDSSWRPAAVASPGNPLPLFGRDVASPTRKSAAGLPNPVNSAPRTALDIQRDIADPRLGPRALPDVNALALGQTRPTAVSPNIEPRRAVPVAPTFAAPKRSF